MWNVILKFDFDANYNFISVNTIQSKLFICLFNLLILIKMWIFLQIYVTENINISWKIKILEKRLFYSFYIFFYIMYILCNFDKFLVNLYVKYWGNL